MAKGPKQKNAQPSSGSVATDPLAEGMTLFSRGDYARARQVLETNARDVALPEGQRELARGLEAATRLERGTLWVGLSCLGLLLLVVLVTALTQP